VSITSIWFGKLLGAVLTVLCCELLVLAPVALLHGLMDKGPLEGVSTFAAAVNQAALVLILFPVTLMLIAHTAGVIWRARSAWIALEITALVVGGLIVWQAWRTVEPFVIFYYDVGVSLVVGSCIALTVGLLISAWVASVWGRTDLRRTHAALSVVLAGLVLTCALGSFGTAQWMVNAGIDELAWIKRLTASPSGQWLALQGGAQRVLPLRRSFLYHHASHEFVNITASLASPRGGTSVSFSNNGEWAVWLESLGDGQYQTVVADLRTDQADVTWTRLFLAGQTAFAISDNGRWLAVRERRDLPMWQRLAGRTWDINTVYELPSGRLLASWTTPDEHESTAPVFVSDSTIRTYAVPTSLVQKGPPTALRVYELDIEKGQATEVAVVPDQSSVNSIEIDRLHERVLLRGWQPSQDSTRFAVIDERSHDRIFVLDPHTGPYGGRALSDGSVAAWRKTCGRIELVLLNSEGDTEEVIDLGRGLGAWLGHETAPGRMAVVLFTHPPGYGRLRVSTIEVDLTNAGTREIGRDLRPVSAEEGLGRVRFTPEPGSILTRCFKGPTGDLKILDPATGQLEQVTPGHRDSTRVHLDWWYWSW
jgi:hypothetical protein